MVINRNQPIVASSVSTGFNFLSGDYIQRFIDFELNLLAIYEMLSCNLNNQPNSQLIHNI